jgi:hypothetical protein
VAVDVVRAIQAFAGNTDVPGSPEKYYAIVNTALDRTKTATYCSETLLADTLLVNYYFIHHARTKLSHPTGVSDIHCLGPQVLGRYCANSSTRLRCR